MSGTLALLMLAGTVLTARAADAAGTCEATLTAAGFTWDGAAQPVGPFDGSTVVVCLASGPPEQLPVSNAIGCLVVNQQPVPVEDGALCTGVLFVRRDGERTLVWVQNDSAVSVWVTRLDWNGAGFDREPPFLACKSPVDPPSLDPVDDPDSCDGGG
jgi:hypothetical protein